MPLGPREIGEGQRGCQGRVASMPAMARGLCPRIWPCVPSRRANGAGRFRQLYLRGALLFFISDIYACSKVALLVVEV